MTGEAGESVRLLERFGRRYAAAVRIAILLPIGVIAMLRAAPEHAAATVFVVGVAATWSCCYGWWLLRATGLRLLTLDVVVLIGVSLSILWTGAVEDVNVGWIRLLVTFACVTYQWYTSLLAGAAAALVTGGSLLTIVTAAVPDTTVHSAMVWMLVAAALSRVTWMLVTRAATRADRLAVAAELARRGARVEAAVRADQRWLANSLHDTAATTLLMVGSGQVPAGTDWLAQQARRDLDRLRAREGPVPKHVDLVALLRADLDAVHQLPCVLELDVPARLVLPYGVARAIADATQEALNNLRRHSGAQRAGVRLAGNSSELRLEVVDDGKGFSTEEVPATRRGMRHSIHDRMGLVGGTATVMSVVDVGTVVRLEWCAPHE